MFERRGAIRENDVVDNILLKATEGRNSAQTPAVDTTDDNTAVSNNGASGFGLTTSDPDRPIGGLGFIGLTGGGSGSPIRGTGFARHGEVEMWGITIVRDMVVAQAIWTWDGQSCGECNGALSTVSESPRYRR